MSMLPLYDDVELLARLRAGEEAAFTQIYRRYWQPLYREAFKRLHDHAGSEEAVQEVFADLWIKREKKQIEKLLPYLQMAVRYQVFMRYKKEKSQEAFEEPLQYLQAPEPVADSLYDANELRTCIDAWLAQQPEKRREIFRLRYMEDLSTKEISERLGVTQKTVQNTLLTAVASLRTSMGKVLILLPLLLERHA